MLSLDEYATIGEACTIAEALVALSKAQLGLTYSRHHHRAILVLDEAGRVVGKLTHFTILRALEPDLLGPNGAESLERAGLDPSFIEALRAHLHRVGGELSLRALCHAAGKIRVRDAMVPAGERIAGQAPLPEAIRSMVAARCQSLLVVERNEVTGIIRLSDLFEEVADMIRADSGGESSGP